jgi:photosystem II stability/assembly factor-like uncharacterized protein/GTPase SAR1 family protein
MIFKNIPLHYGIILCCFFYLFTGCQDTTQWIDQGNSYNHEWKEKAEFGFAFTRSYIATNGSAYVISQNGVVYFRAAGSKTWKKEKMPDVDGSYWDINGCGDEVWILGDRGAILYKKGHEPWVTEKEGTYDTVLTCLYVSENDVWAVGSHGIILHRQKGNWIKEEDPITPVTLLSMAGTPGNLWITGENGTILHKSGDGPWYEQDCPEKNAKVTNLVVQNDDIWAIAENGFVLHKPKKKSWISEKLPTTDSTFSGVYVNGEDVWVSTFQGQIFHRNGHGDWIKEIDSSSTRDLYFIRLFGQNNELWVVGNRGGILHRTAGGTWIQEGQPAFGSLLFDIKRNGNSMLAVGHGESILSKSGNDPWEIQGINFPMTFLTSIFALGDEVWVADKGGVIRYKKGEADWQRQNTDVTDFTILSGYRYGNDVWLIGTQGIILHKTGNGEWLNKTPELGNLRLEGIYGDKDNIYVVGQQGVILHKESGDSIFVNEYPRSFNCHFTSIKRIGDELWVVGGINKVIHKHINAMFWAEEELPGSLHGLLHLHYHDILKKDNKFWICGSSGIVLSKKDGEKWKVQFSDSKETDFYKVHDDGNDLLFVGSNGTRNVIYQKNSDDQWSLIDGVENGLKCIPPSADLYIFSAKGISYKKQSSNWIHAQKPAMLNTITAAALSNDKLYCISDYAVVSLTPDEDQYPIVSSIKYRPILDGQSDSLEIQTKISIPDNKQSRNFKIRFDARPFSPEHERNEEFKSIPDGHIMDSNTNSMTVLSRFEVTRSFGIIPSSGNANKLRVRILLSSQGNNTPFTLRDNEGKLFFTLEPEAWWQHQWFIVIALLVLAFYSALLLVWWLSPLTFIKLYTSDFFTKLAMLDSPVKQLFFLFNMLLVQPIRRFAFTKRVTDAWLHANKTALINAFEQSEVMQHRSHYVSLPLKLKIGGTERRIEHPDSQLPDSLFTSKRAIIQIVGPGGVGKTTLAIAFGNWLIQQLKENKRGTLTRLPIMIDADTTHLIDTVLQQLKARLPDQIIPTDFVKYLLKKQRLVIIMDALSERKAETQHYIKKIHNHIAVNALILTSRRAISIQVKDSILLCPETLNTRSLFNFVKDCLENHPVYPVKDGQEQLSFAEKIAKMVDISLHNAIILPILVKLIIDNILSKFQSYNSIAEMIEAMPANIPQVFYDYLLRMHPRHSTASNLLHDYQVIDVAELMAKLSLNEKFEPGDFKESAIKDLLSKDPKYNNIDVVERFIENHIVTRRQSLGNFYLRFNLDPMAEYLAASRMYDEYQKEDKLQELIMKISELASDTPGFKMIFEQVKNYKVNQAESHEIQ